ncbi:hypothetical protein K438DRAFT_1771486 [Mycena galopus ATCC 62051]|nr:hypothetical protein K438DRAFT_1771486 [Mycena galopus ATCC 62051]
MVLTFENHLAEYRWAREDHVDEDELRDKLFKFVLNMEQVLFWLSRLGFRVTWSANYEQLMERLFPDVLLQFPPAQCRAEFDCLRASLFISRRPSTQGQSGIAPLDAPTGIAQIYWIPAAAPNLRGFTPNPTSDVSSACGSTVQFSMEGILEYLDELASGDGQRVPLEESTPPGHVLVGAELDLWIIALGYLPHLFYGATLPTPPPPPPVAPPAPPPPTAPPVPPVAGPSRVSPPPHPSRSQTKKEGRSRKRTPTVPHADRESETPFAFPSSSQRRGSGLKGLWSALSTRRASVAATSTACVLWRSARCYLPRLHGVVPPAMRCTLPAVGGGNSPMRTRRHCATFEWSSGSTWGQVPFTRCALTHALWIGWRLHTTRTETHCKTAKKAGRRHGPTVVISSGSEDEGPAPKKRKTSQTGCGTSAASSPEVIVVEDEEMPATVDDMRNYDLDGDVPMPPVDPSIAADPSNYDAELEPAPPVVPPEQQASSSRTTLDDPPPVASGPAPHFLGFRLRLIKESSAAARPTFVDEIVQWAIEGKEDETWVESALLFMLAIFSQAGSTLGQRHRNGKGKAREP